MIILFMHRAALFMRSQSAFDTSVFFFIPCILILLFKCDWHSFTLFCAVSVICFISRKSPSESRSN